MSEQSYSVEKDLKEAQAMASALVPYIYEDELYGRVAMNIPSLTLGALMLRLRRLRTMQNKLNNTQVATLEQLERQLEDVRKEWATHYQKKLVREGEARLRDIQGYIRECRDDPRSCVGNYPVEALRRTMIQEVLNTMGEAETEKTGLKAKAKTVDAELRRYLQPSDFIWDEQLKAIYPQDTFWWLYSRPKPPN
jgi:hypothetical protein